MTGSFLYHFFRVACRDYVHQKLFEDTTDTDIRLLWWCAWRMLMV